MKQLLVPTYVVFIAILIASMNQKLQAQVKSNSSQNTESTIPIISQNQKDLSELIQKRNQFSKTILNLDGSFKLITSPQSLHYKQNTQWLDIDNTIHENNSSSFSDYSYCNTANAFKTFYPSNLHEGHILTRLKEGELKESIESMYVTNNKGEIVYQFQPNSSTNELNGSFLNYDEIFPNCTAQYIQQSDQRKFNLILKDISFFNNIPSTASYLILREKLILSRGMTSKLVDNTLEIYSNNQRIAIIPCPVAQEDFASEKNATEKGTLSCSIQHNELTIETKFSLKWLRNSNRNFPISLDPTTIFYPDSVMFATGKIASATSPMVTGFLNVNGASLSVAWARFNISSISPIATITGGHYWGYLYSSAGTSNKIVSVKGLQSIDPYIATSTQVYNQITSGPTYDPNYVWGNTIGWHQDTLNASGLSDITSQISSGKTTLGFLYSSGSTSDMFQYGYDATIPGLQPYLSLDYTIPPCTGILTPTISPSSTLSVCIGDTIHYLVSNNTYMGSGITYQWYNASGAISGATDSVYNVVVASNDFIHCEVFCPFGGSTISSNIDTLTILPSFYCYCHSSAYTSGDEDIYKVSLNGSNTNPLYSNTNNCLNQAPGYGSSLSKYSNFISLGNFTTLQQGSLVPFQVSINECDGPPYYWSFAGAFIDFNHNLSFGDPGEYVYFESIPGLSPRIVNASIMIPATASIGQTVLRVIDREGLIPSDGCGNYSWGETEDYLINIVAGTPCSGAPTPGNTIANHIVICPGDSLILTTQNFTSGLGVSYQWYNSSGAIPGATDYQYHAFVTSASTYYCAVTCTTSGITTNSTPITITIGSTVSVSSSVSACDNYIWNFISYTSSGTYTQTFAAANGCDSIHTLNLTINNSTTNTINQSGCNSYTWPLTGTTYTTSGNYSVLFFTTQGCDSNVVLHLTLNMPTTSTVNQTVCSSYTLNGQTYTATGIYTQVFTNSIGCDSIITINLFVNAPNINITNNSPTLISNATGSSYQWMNCNGNLIIPGATNQSYTATANGSYAVIVTTGGCIDTSSCITVTNDGLNDLEINQFASIYPNPTNGIFQVELNRDVELSIQNPLGETILKRSYRKGVQRIDISDKENGIYIIKVKSDGMEQQIKLNKQK